MPTVSDLQEELTRIYPELPKELKKAAKFVLAHPTEISLHSIRQIAERAEVHPSTMVRLIKALGFARYDAFKLVYIRAVSETPVSNFKQQAESIATREKEVPLDRYERSVYASLASVFSDDTYDKLDQIADLLLQVERSYIFGMRGSFSVAFYLHYLLHFPLDNVSLIRGQEGMLLSEITQISANDLIIIFGASPLATETVQLLDKIKHHCRKVKLISITDSYTSQIAADSDITLALGNHTINFMPSLLVYNACIEILVAKLIEKGGDKVIQRIRDFEQSLSRVDAYARDQ